MIFLILAFAILGAVTLVGYYQGGLRAAFSFIGLFVAAFLAIPTSGLARFVLPVFGVEHPVVLDFLCPFIMFVLIMIVFKVAAYLVNQKMDTFIKYKASETAAGLYDRLNRRLGICVGVANGAIYVFLVSMVIYVLGYGSVQLAHHQEEHWTFKTLNLFAKDIQSTGFQRSLAPIVPASPFYFDAVDTLSYLFHTPLLQRTVSGYPAFLRVAEQSEFQLIGEDGALQASWVTSPSLTSFISNPKINALVKDGELYEQLMELTEGDLEDFKTYLETKESEKYGDELILGRWKFNVSASWNEALRIKPNMNLAEKKWLSAQLQGVWSDTVLTAYVDNTLGLKRPNGASPFTRGRWEHAYGPKYNLSVSDGGSRGEYEAIIRGSRLVINQDKLSLVFEKIQ